MTDAHLPRRRLAASLTRLAPVAAAALSALALTAGSPAALPPVTVADKVGDAAGAPDLTKVVVSSTAASISFGLAFAEPFQADGQVVLVLDTDRSEVTGDKYGDDMWMKFRYIDEQSYGWDIWHWNGSDWEEALTGAKVMRASDGVRLVVDRKELRGSWSFTWFVLTLPGGSGERGDSAPEKGAGTHWLRGGARDYDERRDRGVIKSVYTAFVPGLATFEGVKPGTLVELQIVGVKLPSGDRMDVTDVQCSAGVDGRLIIAVRPCAWRTPHDARGRTMLVEVAVLYKGVVYRWGVSKVKVL